MRSVPDHDREIFDNLFVLEAANNHWGDTERGKRIIQEFGTVVRFNNVKAAIKFQFRDVENFIHDDYKGNTDIRYIKKNRSHKNVTPTIWRTSKCSAKNWMYSNGHPI